MPALDGTVQSGQFYVKNILMTADMMTKGTQIRNLPLHSQQEDAMLHYQAKP